LVTSNNLEEILKAEKIYHIDKDIRLMTREELSEYFAADSSGRILLAKLIKNTIWQAYEKIRSGEETPISGNIRTFWYLWIKPVLAHIPDDDEVKTDPYDTMLKAFTRMIMDLKLFRYADFDFTDENWENRRIGTRRPEVLIFSEKTGWIRFLRDMYDGFGVSILALGGAPSALTSEYTAEHLKYVISEEQAVQLIGIVDYDPSGDLIASAFKDQLAATGLPNTTLKNTILPEHYLPEEIELFKYPVTEKQKTKNNNWLKKTGGINGELYGLESESMPRERLRTLIEQLINNIQ
jgi:hypothetical protein